MKKKMLHILYCFEMGGIQNRLTQMLNHPDMQIYDHVIVALSGNRTFFDSISWQYDSVSYMQMNYCSQKIGHNLKQFYHLLSAEKWAGICTYNWGSMEAVIVNKWVGLPHIHHEDGFSVTESHKQNIKRCLLRALFLRNTPIIVPSQSLQKIALEQWYLPEKNIHFIPNGTILEDFKPLAKPLQKKYILGTVAMCRPEKNLQAFIDIVAYCCHTLKLDVGGILVGDGSELQALKQYTKDKNLTEDDFLFTGYQQNFMAYLAHFDVFILTSHTEQQPYSILQAMSLGKPIYAVNVGDVFEMVSLENQDFIEETGGCVAPYEKLQTLLADKDLQQLIGNKNKEFWQEYYQQEKLLLQRIKSLRFCCDKIKKE